MDKPLIGVLSSTALLPNERFDSIDTIYINKSYVEAIIKNGGIPIIIPPSIDKSLLYPVLGLISGLLLPGGDDVDPCYYNEEPHAKLGTVRPEIDEYSFICTEYAFKNNLPILGICRGMQLLNIAKGGTLYQDLSQRLNESLLHLQSYSRSYLAHSIYVEKSSLLFELLKEPTVKVNTMHHQAINKIGNGLYISSYAKDGIIESFESPDGNILAVQWHPEELSESAPNMNNLFIHFISKAKNYIKP